MLFPGQAVLLFTEGVPYKSYFLIKQGQKIGIAFALWVYEAYEFVKIFWENLKLVPRYNRQMNILNLGSWLEQRIFSDDFKYL